VKDFELGTEKSDKSRFRGFCKSKGCPWIIRAKTQRDLGVSANQKYVHEYYSVKKLKAAYAGQIPNITDKGQWPVVDKGYKVFPPLAKKKRPPGREKE
jgi:hypothetical protein